MTMSLQPIVAAFQKNSSACLAQITLENPTKFTSFRRVLVFKVVWRSVLFSHYDSTSCPTRRLRRWDIFSSFGSDYGSEIEKNSKFWRQPDPIFSRLLAV